MKDSIANTPLVPRKCSEDNSGSKILLIWIFKYNLCWAAVERVKQDHVKQRISPLQNNKTYKPMHLQITNKKKKKEVEVLCKYYLRDFFSQSAKNSGSALIYCGVSVFTHCAMRLHQQLEGS